MSKEKEKEEGEKEERQDWLTRSKAPAAKSEDLSSTLNLPGGEKSQLLPVELTL